MKKSIRKNVLLTGWVLVAMMAASATWAASQGVGNTLTDASPQSEEAVAVEFQGRGFVDRMGAGEIVIDDVLFRLAPSVSYFAEGGGSLGSASFSAGTLVGYVLALENEHVIQSLWKLPLPPQP